MPVQPGPLDHSVYQNPLVERYSSEAMLRNFSSDARYRTWRDLWIGLAEIESELGLDIRPEQSEPLKASRETIPYERVRELERELRHDVMAHIRAFGEQAPDAAGIIHLGATSCFVTDNADLVLAKKGLELIAQQLAALLHSWRQIALEHRSLPTLAYTHYQPAQLTTLGKRVCLWAQDFLMDLQEVERLRDGLRFRGTKGATGTQASFLRLFDGNGDKVRELDRRLAKRMGFSDTFTITGQTYTRKLDAQILNVLSGIALTAHMCTNDLRLLQGVGEIEEPFGKSQVGSSAMPYKRNPMMMERMSSLAKWVMTEAQNGAWVASTQWFERTLDDSANRRLSIPQAFLAVDAMLILANRVAEGLVVYPKVIERRVREELPFIAGENILMLAVKMGGDRQQLHERLREHCMAVAEARRAGATENTLLQRIRDDEAFASVRDALDGLMIPENFYGRAPDQVVECVESEGEPALASYDLTKEGGWEVTV